VDSIEYNKTDMDKFVSMEDINYADVIGQVGEI